MYGKLTNLSDNFCRKFDKNCRFKAKNPKMGALG
jgi:hypothetical protein